MRLRAKATADVAPNADAYRQFERREGVSLAQASVAIVSVEGAPRRRSPRVFRRTLTREARARDIVVVDAAKARYLVRGYLSADR